MSVFGLLFPLSESKFESKKLDYFWNLLVILNQAVQVEKKISDIITQPPLADSGQEALRQQQIHMLYDQKFSFLRIVACGIIFARIKILPKITDRLDGNNCQEFLDQLERHISPVQNMLFRQMGCRGELNGDPVIQRAEEKINAAKKQFLTNNS
jgi:hypothetical protein